MKDRPMNIVDLEPAYRVNIDWKRESGTTAVNEAAVGTATGWAICGWISGEARWHSA
jgi:hypothetical protein